MKLIRTILIGMPFADIHKPLLGVSLLKAALIRDGFPCDLAYFNFQYAQRIGIQNYTKINNFETSTLLGEWIFALDLFGDKIPNPTQFYVDILKPVLSRPCPGGQFPFDDIESEASLLSSLTNLQLDTSEYLTSCLKTYDWNAYDLVGFTTTFQQNVASLALARKLKASFPHLFIVFGGANCEGEMGKAMIRLFPFVDAICSGEGDIAFPQLVASLAKGEGPTNIPGIISQANKGSKFFPLLSNPIMDMDSLPIPDYSDFFSHSKTLPEVSRLSLPVESSRGCWWGEISHCTFCGLNGNTMKFRAKSPSRFLVELRELVERYQIYNLTAVDNIIDMRYFRTFLPKLAEAQLEITLFYETKANLRKDEVRLLRESGVKKIQPGIESLSSQVLSLMGKGLKAYQNIQLLKWCAEYFVQPFWNFLAGFPNEDGGEYLKQAQIIASLSHLPPPTGLCFVRLDRFSPLFVREKEAGLSNVKGSKAYRYIYPFALSDINQLAYYFDFEYLDGRDPETYTSELRVAIDHWRSGEDLGKLVSLDFQGEIAIKDARKDAVRESCTLSGWHRAIYLACDVGSTTENMMRILIEQGFLDVNRAALQDFLDLLIKDRLILLVDGRYLSLAISADYQVNQLGRLMATGAEIPEDFKAPIQILFDFHKDIFGEQLHKSYMNACSKGISGSF